MIHNNMANVQISLDFKVEMIRFNPHSHYVWLGLLLLEFDLNINSQSPAYL